MGTKRIGAAALAALTGTTVLTIGMATPSFADSDNRVDITSVGDVVVDGVHDRVFITDPKAGKVLATDYAGEQVGSAVVGNATNLALSNDSSRLYVTSPSGQAVVVLDTVTLAETGKLSTGGVTPMDVAFAGGRVWFSYQSGANGNLGTIDPSAETPTAVLDRFVTGYPGVSEIALASASAAPNRLAIATHDRSAILEVSEDAVTTMGSVKTNLAVGDLAMSPDGNRIATVIGEDYAVTLRDVNDMAAARTLALHPYPVAVDFGRDGTIATGSAVYYDGVDLQTFTATGEPLNKVVNDPGEVQGHGVAWEPDGDRLFSLSERYGDFVLTTWTSMRYAPSQLALANTPPAVPGAPITVTGTLTSAVPLRAGTTVSVSRSGTSLGTAPVGADGAFRFTDTPPVADKATYEVSYAGDSDHAPATATTSVTITRVATTLILSAPASAPRAKALTVSGSLTSPLTLPAGSKVSVTRTDMESPAGVSLGLKPVWSNGGFSFTDTPQAGGTVTYRVAYAGGSTHTPASASKAITVSRATPSMSVNNHGKVYAYGQTVSFTAYLGPTYKNRVVEIWADPAGTDQARRLVKRATVNSAGYIAANLQLTRNTTVSAVFTGDTRYAPRTVTATVGTRVAISVNPVNAYGTKKISGINYYAYRDTKYASLNLYVGNNRETRKVYFVMQRYVNGKWQNQQTEYFLGNDQLYLRGAGMAGVRLRATIAYISGTSGDSLNVTTWAPYKYFTFTK